MHPYNFATAQAFSEVSGYNSQIPLIRSSESNAGNLQNIRAVGLVTSLTSDLLRALTMSPIGDITWLF
jgi:hypothetical protein